ncbi:MAG TPA: alpha/beta hydrolase [Caulobacteraceae bacterium]|nr:alpha/beta hydrolase [Caulobacteraceae bacterium]
MTDALARQMPPVRYADLSDIRMAYYEAGPTGGFPVIFCHGFPELAFSWRYQLKAFEAAGRRAIAADQRGYGLTDRPADVETYDMEHLCGDQVRLLDRLGIEKAVFCGHDWGGALVWQMPLRHPDRVAGVIGLNTPFIPRAPADPIAIMRKRMGEDMYMVHFQKPGEADAIFAADVRKTMNFFLRRPPADAAPSAGLASRRDANAGSTFPLVKMVQAYDPALDTRPPFLSDDEMDVFVETYERTGFTGGINWYRNLTRNWQIAAGQVEKVEAPSLMIMADGDAVLPPSAADGMEAFIPDLEKVLIENCGHWTQQEKPNEVNAAILGWLDRRFPK